MSHGHKRMPSTMAHGGWMEEAFSKNPGKLHRTLNVPQGEKIPAKKLAKAAGSSSGTVRKEVALAKLGRRFGGH